MNARINALVAPRRAAVTAGVVVAAAAVAIGGVSGIDHLERSRSLSRARAAADAAAVRLDEALHRQESEMELLAHNAASNPRLVAAVRADVSRQTLKDIFENEPWWAPYREVFPSYALATGREGAKPVLGPELDAAAVDDLVTRARSHGRTTIGFVSGLGRKGVAWAVAEPLVTPGRTPVPVLVFGRPLGSLALAGVATHAKAAVLLVQGGRPRVGAGPLAQMRALKAASAAGDATAPGAVPSFVRRSVTPDAYLVSAVVAPARERTLLLTFGFLRVACCVIVSLALAIFFLARRRPATATPAAPETAELGKYVLLERIGGGGMADVFLAVSVGESGFRRSCVVKRLRPELSEDPLAIAQFTDEATLASSLVHANIVPIFDFGRIGNRYFLVEEYVVGRDLGRVVERLKENGRPPLPVSALAFVACEMLKALDYAHQKADVTGVAMGLVHRDVSPANVMISLAAEVKLLDFGVLKAVGSRNAKHDRGTLKGSLSYMSPEQAKGQEVDRRADLYGLALVLYTCLRGEPLFDGAGTTDLMMKAARGVGAAELGKIASLPTPFAAVLRRALSPHIDDRYQDAATFLQDLIPFADGGAAELGEIMRELFESELRTEQRALTSGSGVARISGLVASAGTLAATALPTLTRTLQ